MLQIMPDISGLWVRMNAVNEEFREVTIFVYKLYETSLRSRIINHV